MISSIPPLAGHKEALQAELLPTCLLHLQASGIRNGQIHGWSAWLPNKGTKWVPLKSRVITDSDRDSMHSI